MYRVYHIVTERDREKLLNSFDVLFVSFVGYGKVKSHLK